MPTIVIDPVFSVYRLVERIKDKSTLLNHRRTMSLISYEIENATIVDRSRGRIFAGFQRMSKFLAQMERYKQLAANAERVYVFGIPDVVPPMIPNITYVYLRPEDQLSKEWFLVSHGQAYLSALATEELTSIDDPDEKRVFQGIWTFDMDMVRILEEWLTGIVDAPPLHVQEDHYDLANQVRLMNASMQRLMNISTRKKTDTQEILNTEIRTVVKASVHPAMMEMSGDYAKSSHEQEVVILFSDLRNFTALTEQMRPNDLVEQVINPYLKVVSSVVYKHGGTIDKFLGDGVLAIFGLETTTPQDADHALAAAQEIMAILRGRKNTPAVGIGLAKGQVLVGEIGSEVRSEKTVIGDAVNVAQRLSSLAKNDIWLTQPVYECISRRQELRSAGEVELKGKAERQQVYQVV